MLSPLSFPGTTPSYFLLLDWLPFLILLCKLFLLYSVFTCCCSLSPGLGPIFLFLPYKFSLNNLINFDHLNNHICQWISNLYLILGPLIWAPDWWYYYLLQGSTLDSTMPSSVWHLGLPHPYTCFFSWAPNLLKKKNLGIILNFPPIFSFSLTADPWILFSLDSVYFSPFPWLPWHCPGPSYHNLLCVPLCSYLVTQKDLLQTFPTLQLGWSFESIKNCCISLLQICLQFPIAFIIKPKVFNTSY